MNNRLTLFPISYIFYMNCQFFLKEIINPTVKLRISIQGYFQKGIQTPETATSLQFFK